MNLQTDCQAAFFVSSSGHCSLDCEYCVASPVVKHEASLTIDDIRFLVEAVNKKSFFAFSGKGDFFAGYRKNERLLENVLKLDVEIALDVNAVMIHEFADLTAPLLRKIRYLNISCHYHELKKTNALKVWPKNAKILIDAMQSVHGDCRDSEDILIVDFIASPKQRDLWEEALAYYEETLFAETGKRIVIARDVTQTFSAEDEARLVDLQARYAHLVARLHQEDFAARFRDFAYVLCPAGKDFFRVWNDGRIEGCPYINELRESGNAKERRLTLKSQHFQCSTPNFCDCSAIAMIDKMIYPEAARIDPEQRKRIIPVQVA